MTKSILSILKTFIIAVVIVFSLEKGFSYSDVFNINDVRGAWLINVAVHTLLLSILFILIESLVNLLKVNIETHLYLDPAHKKSSLFANLKIDQPLDVFWYIKVSGKRYALPKYIKLAYSEDLVFQLKKKNTNYIIIDDVKKIIKIDLKKFLPEQSKFDGYEKNIKLTVINDNCENGDVLPVAPICKNIIFVRKVEIKTFNFKVKGE